MAELPELETIRRSLEKEVVGKRVRSVDVVTMSVIERHPNKKHFGQKLEGTKLKSLSRRGEHFVLTLDSSELFVIHLGSGGVLRKVPSKEEKEKHTHVLITFTQGGDLRLVDPKAKAEMFVTTPEELDEQVPALAQLGLDAVESPVSWTDFARTVVGQEVKLKTFLTDPSIIVGLGPVYSDEVLFQAGLRYDRGTETLSTQEIRRLYRALVETLHDAIKHHGTSIPEAPYRDLHGDEGGYQSHLEAYGRDGEPCRRCRRSITKAKFGGRNVYFCPDCQV